MWILGIESYLTSQNMPSTLISISDFTRSYRWNGHISLAFLLTAIQFSVSIHQAGNFSQILQLTHSKLYTHDREKWMEGLGKFLWETRLIALFYKSYVKQGVAVPRPSVPCHTMTNRKADIICPIIPLPESREAGRRQQALPGRHRWSRPPRGQRTSE